MCSSIEPCEATAKCLHLQFSVFKESLINSSYLVFSSCRGLDGLCHIYHLVGIEVQSDNSIVALGLLGLFLNAQTIAICIKLSHAISLRVAHPITKYSSLLVFFGSANSL